MSSVIHSFSWQTAQTIFRGAAGVIVASIIAKNYGKEQLGVLDSSFAFINLIAAIAGLGLPKIITRELCCENKEYDFVKGSSFFLSLFMCITCFIAVNLFAPYSTKSERLVILSASLLLLVQPFAYIMTSFYESKGRMDIIGKILFIGLTISSALRITIALLGAPVYWLALAYSTDFTIVCVVGWTWAYRKFPLWSQNWKYDFSTVRRLLRESLPLLMASMAAFMYSTMDILMLRWMSGLEETGLYGAAIRISQIPLFLPGILTGVYTAKLMASRNTTGNFANADLTLLARILVGIGFLILVSGWLLGPFAVKILYGESFSEAGSLLQIHVIGVFFMFIGSMRNHLLVLEGRGKLILLSDICGALMNLVLNLWLIPRHGAMGASVATAISYFTAFFLINVIHPDLRKYNRLLYSAFRNKATLSH